MCGTQLLQHPIADNYLEDDEDDLVGLSNDRIAG